MSHESRSTDLGLHDLVVRNARQLSLILVVLCPFVTLVSVATGEAELRPALIFLAVVWPCFIIALAATYTRAGRLWPGWIAFAGTLVAGVGVIFSPMHLTLGYKPYALLSPMTPLALAAIAPVRPLLSYPLAVLTAISYALSLVLVPPTLPTTNPWGYLVLCLSMAWMGATLSRSQLWLWAELERVRRSALEATRLKSEFLANMSHEIRTPMTAILGFADEAELELQRSPAFEALRNMLTTIQRNGAHLLALINGILDLSKIEAGKLEVRREPCAPLAIVAEVRSLLGAQAQDRGLSLEAHVATAVPQTIACDRTRLRQILINLVGNAVKFTDRGGVRMELRLVETPGSAPQLEIAIADTGHGMSEAETAQLFESFKQLPGSSACVHQGTGLGLALSRQLARLLGGDITVASCVGVGSRFCLRLPAESDYAVPMLSASEAQTLVSAEPQAAPAAPAAPRVLQGRVLVVEDGVDSQRLIAAVLRRTGLDVEVAGDGERGCELALAADAAGAPYDTILMDMQMPVLDGAAAVRRLRERGYAGSIIALTANAMTGAREHALAIGCDDYATKPIDRPDLLRRIEAQLAKRSAAS